MNRDVVEHHKSPKVLQRNYKLTRQFIIPTMAFHLNSHLSKLLTLIVVSCLVTVSYSASLSNTKNIAPRSARGETPQLILDDIGEYFDSLIYNIDIGEANTSAEVRVQRHFRNTSTFIFFRCR